MSEVVKEKRFLGSNDVAEIMECSQAMAYKIIKQLNRELEERGYITLAGKINSKYFYERTYDGIEVQEGV